MLLRLSSRHLSIAATLSASVSAIALAITGCGAIGHASDHAHAEDPVDGAHRHQDHRGDLDSSHVATHLAASSNGATEPLDAAAGHAMLHDTGVDPRAACV